MAPEATVNFSTFLISLAGSALVHLGEVDDPNRQARVDLVLARQTIDVIQMLAEKTRNNLDEDEQRLLEAIQAELHSKYNARISKS
jgi:hypothetical protein